MLDDWETCNERKLAVTAKAHPQPTKWPQVEVQPVAPPLEACKIPAMPASAAQCDGPSDAVTGGQVAAAGPEMDAGSPSAAATLSLGTVEVNQLPAVMPHVASSP